MRSRAIHASSRFDPRRPCPCAIALHSEAASNARSARRPRHGATVTVAEPLLPEIVALMVAVWLVEMFFPFTVAVAAELSPVDVTLDDGVIVAAPEANHETVRP